MQVMELEQHLATLLLHRKLFYVAQYLVKFLLLYSTGTGSELLGRVECDLREYPPNSSFVEVVGQQLTDALRTVSRQVWISSMKL